MSNEGVPEVPNHLDVVTRRFLTAMRNLVIKQQVSRVPPTNPTNVVVTPIAGGNVVQFTRGADADNTILYVGNSADFTSSVPVPLGLAVQYTDYVGQGNVTRFYWLRSMRGLTQAPTLSASFKGVTLALGVGAVVPNPPPASSTAIREGTSGHTAAGIRKYGGDDAL